MNEQEMRELSIERGWIQGKHLVHDHTSQFKICSLCKVEKPQTAEFFYRSGDKFHYNCKECKRKIDKESRKNSDKHKAYQKSPNFVFSQLKHQAKKQNYPFEITFEYYLKNLADAPCAYCGSTNTKHWVDRAENNAGYTQDNTVACCEPCNKSKAHRDKQEWIDHCKRVAEFNS